jgi:radical SAM superfamily enzyme YgiQ (UPF0313 family)
VELEDLALRLSAGEIAGDERLADSAAEWLLQRAAPRAEARAPASPRVTGRDDLGGPMSASGDDLVIGLSVMGATLPIALLILERLRAHAPRAQLWLGGPGTTGVDVALVERFPFLDAVVRGEGELTVPELCAAIAARKSPRGVHGVTWRDDFGRMQREPDREPVRDLADLAPYAWDLLPPIREYKRITGEADGLVPIDSGRGCVYDCSFCTIGRFWNRRSRTLPAKMLADEVESLRAIPAARSAYLCHDIFGANRGQAVAFCEEMLRRAIDVPWEVRARADHLDRELLELMGRAGCYRVLIGVESADDAVRGRNQKGMRADVDMLAVVDDCARAGITPILSLILGLPGEDEPALRKSLDLCAAAALRAGVNVSLHLVNPQPGCGLGQEFGPTSRPLEGIPPDMALGAGETAAERALIAAHPDLFSTWSLLPLGEERLRDLHAIATTLPEVLMRYPRTFAFLCARRAADALDLYRAWRTHGKSFESFARAERDRLVDEALRWEQALVRQSSHAVPPDRAQATRRGPFARGEVLACEHDLPSLCDRLKRGVRPLAIERRPTTLCVVPTTYSTHGARGVETLRISSDVARVWAQIDGSETAPELESRMPGIGTALERLAAAGLVVMPVSSASIPAISHSASMRSERRA